MRLQHFAHAHELDVAGEIEVTRDRFARFYVEQKRIALTRPDGIFTTLICADGQTFYVMTSDWQEVERQAGAKR